MGKDPDTLRLIGEALFGKSWQGSLSDRLQIKEETFRKVLAGKSTLSDGVWRDIWALGHTRVAEIAGATQMLGQALGITQGFQRQVEASQRPDPLQSRDFGKL